MSKEKAIHIIHTLCMPYLDQHIRVRLIRDIMIKGFEAFAEPVAKPDTEPEEGEKRPQTCIHYCPPYKGKRLPACDTCYYESPIKKPEEGEKKTRLFHRICPHCERITYFYEDIELPLFCCWCRKGFDKAPDQPFQFGDLVKHMKENRFGFVFGKGENLILVLVGATFFPPSKEKNVTVLGWTGWRKETIQFVESNLHLKTFQEVYDKLTGKYVA